MIGTNWRHNCVIFLALSSIQARITPFLKHPAPLPTKSFQPSKKIRIIVSPLSLLPPYLLLFPPSPPSSSSSIIPSLFISPNYPADLDLCDSSRKNMDLPLQKEPICHTFHSNPSSKPKKIPSDRINKENDFNPKKSFPTPQNSSKTPKSTQKKPLFKRNKSVNKAEALLKQAKKPCFLEEHPVKVHSTLDPPEKQRKIENEPSKHATNPSSLMNYPESHNPMFQATFGENKTNSFQPNSDNSINPPVNPRGNSNNFSDKMGNYFNFTPTPVPIQPQKSVENSNLGVSGRLEEEFPDKSQKNLSKMRDLLDLASSIECNFCKRLVNINCFSEHLNGCLEGKGRQERLLGNLTRDELFEGQLGGFDGVGSGIGGGMKSNSSIENPLGKNK